MMLRYMLLMHVYSVPDHNWDKATVVNEAKGVKVYRSVMHNNYTSYVSQLHIAGSNRNSCQRCDCALTDEASLLQQTNTCF